MKGKVYTEREKHILISLIKENSKLTSKKTDDVSLREKNDIWKNITETYNAQPDVNIKRTTTQLKKLWNNLKQRTRKLNTERRQHILKTGGGPPLADSDSTLELVNEAFPNVDMVLHCSWDSDAVFENNMNNLNVSEETVQAKVQCESTQMQLISQGQSIEAFPLQISTKENIQPKSQEKKKESSEENIQPRSQQKKRKSSEHFRLERCKRALDQQEEIHEIRMKTLKMEFEKTILEKEKVQEDLLRAKLQTEKLKMEIEVVQMQYEKLKK